MNHYKINKKFGKFIFNEKTRANKIRWFEVDEIIDEKEFNRLSRATQAYCNKINNRKRNSTKKK